VELATLFLLCCMVAIVLLHKSIAFWLISIGDYVVDIPSLYIEY
jgi:hypothetical protein